MSELYDEVCAFWKEEFLRDPNEGVVAVTFQRLFEESPMYGEQRELRWSFAFVQWRGEQFEARACGSSWDESAMLLMGELAKLHALIQDLKAYIPWMYDSIRNNALRKEIAP